MRRPPTALARLFSGPLVAEPLEPLVAQVKELADAADAEATKSAYDSDWSTFVRWCTAIGLPYELPVEPKTVATYLAALYRAGLKVNTIERALAGIVSRHRAHDKEWITPDLIRNELRGIRKRRRKAGEVVTKKTAITADKLISMVAAIGTTELLDIRDRVLLLLTWDTASRESEITGLDVADLIFQPQRGVVIVPQHTKTDQMGKRTAKPVAYATNPERCAVRALRKWLQRSGIAAGPVFRAVTHEKKVTETRLTTKSFRTMVKKRVQAIGLDPDEYSGHSLRSGWITTARRGGRDMTAIMSRTHQTSEATVREYIQYEDLFDKNASVGLLDSAVAWQK